ncbi:hypothetical protein KCU87_g109, partial [Aureobasidium melanogenum]
LLFGQGSLTVRVCGCSWAGTCNRDDSWVERSTWYSRLTSDRSSRWRNVSIGCTLLEKRCDVSLATDATVSERGAAIFLSIHATFLSDVGVHRSAAFDLPSNSLGFRCLAFVVWVGSIDGGSVKILVVVTSDIVEGFVGSELIPFSRTRIVFERHIDGDLDIGHGMIFALTNSQTRIGRFGGSRREDTMVGSYGEVCNQEQKFGDAIRQAIGYGGGSIGALCDGVGALRPGLRSGGFPG